jgi:hypothetical protein
MTLKQDLEMALAALKYHQEQTRPITQTQDAIAALETRLANLADEPVAWAVYDIRYGGSKHLHWNEQHEPGGDTNIYSAIPLYSHPAAADTERLDWMCRNRAQVEWSEFSPSPKCRVLRVDWMEEWTTVCGWNQWFDNYREAIDEAMKEEQKHGTSQTSRDV